MRIASFRRARVAAALSALHCVAASSVLAADVAGMKTIDLPLLLDLPGDLAYVRYTPGSLDRSAAVQARFERFAEEFTRTGFDATAFVLYVLSREDWQAAGLSTPYGLPHPLGVDAIAVPGWADEALVADYRKRLGGEVPLPHGYPILATPQEAGALGVADLLTGVEAARILVRRSPFGGDAPWIEPLLTHLTLRLAWDKFEPGRIVEIAAIFDRLAAQHAPPAPHRLAEWRDDLPEPERYWFEARFLRGADAIVTSHRRVSIWKVFEKAMRGKDPITEALLLKKFPELANWRALNFAPN
jgi:hypothetical protein